MTTSKPKTRATIAKEWRNSNKATINVNEAFTRMLTEFDVNPLKIKKGSVDDMFKLFDEISTRQIMAVTRYGSKTLHQGLLSDLKTQSRSKGGAL